VTLFSLRKEMMFYNVTAVTILISDNEYWAVMVKGETGVQEFAMKLSRLVKSFSETERDG
jgi:hypothetical protein